MNADLTPEWEKEFKRIQFNAVRFIEEYYNKLHPENLISLSDDEKQKIYDRYKAVPLLNGDDISSYFARIKELKDKGYKDWEIY